MRGKAASYKGEASMTGITTNFEVSSLLEA